MSDTSTHPTYGWQTAKPEGKTMLVITFGGERIAQCTLKAKVNGPRKGERRVWLTNYDDDGNAVSYTGIAVDRAGNEIARVERVVGRDEAFAQLDALVADALVGAA